MFIWLWSTVGTFALGLFLVVRGWRGRRHGGAPMCRKCDYNLTGLESERCPECGTTLGRRTIVHGPRRRSWAFIACGGIVLMLGLLSIQSTLLEIKARQHRFFPFRLLVDLAAGGDRRAMIEIGNRIREKRLSEDQAHRLADWALAMVGATPRPFDHWWLRLVELDEADLLLDTHRKRMMGRAASPFLLARSEIRQGDPLVAELSSRTTALPLYSRRFEPTEIRTGNRIIYQLGEETDRLVSLRTTPSGGVTDIQRYVLDSTDLPVGTSKLVIEGDSRFRGSWEPALPERSSLSRRERFETTITILASNAPDPVTWDEYRSWNDYVQEQLRVSVTGDCSTSRYWEGSYVRFDRIERVGAFYDIPFSSCGDFWQDPLPVSLAMEVIVEAGGRELPTELLHLLEDCPDPPEGLAAPAGGWWAVFNHAARVPVFDHDEFYIILRSSKDVARRTLNMDSVWHGELRYGPFPIRHAGGGSNP